jgi:hypothetical protein
VAVDAGNVFVVDEIGLYVIPGQCPGATGFTPPAAATRAAPRLSVHPNPFHSSALLDLTLASSGDVTLRVFDASGRKVRQLVNGVLPTGVTAVRWDGRNERGDHVGSGVYFLWLEWPGGSLSRRIAVVR